MLKEKCRLPQVICAVGCDPFSALALPFLLCVVLVVSPACIRSSQGANAKRLADAGPPVPHKSHESVFPGSELDDSACQLYATQAREAVNLGGSSELLDQVYDDLSGVLSFLGILDSWTDSIEESVSEAVRERLSWIKTESEGLRTRAEKEAERILEAVALPQARTVSTPTEFRLVAASLQDSALAICTEIGQVLHLAQVEGKQARFTGSLDVLPEAPDEIDAGRLYRILPLSSPDSESGLREGEKPPPFDHVVFSSVAVKEAFQRKKEGLNGWTHKVARLALERLRVLAAGHNPQYLKPIQAHNGLYEIRLPNNPRVYGTIVNRIFFASKTQGKNDHDSAGPGNQDNLGNALTLAVKLLESTPWKEMAAR